MSRETTVFVAFDSATATASIQSALRAIEQDVPSARVSQAGGQLLAGCYGDTPIGVVLTTSSWVKDELQEIDPTRCLRRPS